MKYNIRLKGSSLWKLAALIIMVIVITCCATEILSITQPSTATVKQKIDMSMRINYIKSQTDQKGRLVIAILMPTGWKGKDNMTMQYKSPNNGDGTLEPIPASQLEKISSKTWPQALMAKFGLAGNYVNDMEWVAFQSDEEYFYSVQTITVNIQLTVGADNNNCKVKLAYVTAETFNGLHDKDSYAETNPAKEFEYWAIKTTDVLEVTGGSIEDFVDYQSPVLAYGDPGSSLIDDFVTFTFDGAVQPTALLNAPFVRLKATAVTSDGTEYPVHELTDKTKMVEVFPQSNQYKLTIWPRVYFNIPSTKTVTRINYTITDKDGLNEVGIANDATKKFAHKFKCN